MRNKPRLERPAEVVTSKMVRVLKFLSTKIAVTLQEVANQFSIGKASAHQILHETLGVSKVKCEVDAETANRRPKGIQGDLAKEHFGCFNHDKNTFLNSIITGGKFLFIMLNLKQRFSQSSENELVSRLPRSLNCLYLLAGYAGCFVGFTWNNTGSFHTQISNYNC